VLQQIYLNTIWLSAAFNLPAKYADWATAIGQRILVPNFADRGVSHGQRGGRATAVNRSFLDRIRYFSLK
jgi:hypothetical protein